MKLILILGLVLFSTPSFSTTAVTKVNCEAHYAVNGTSQPIVSFQMDVSNVGSCDTKAGSFAVPGTPLQIGFSFVADCQKPTKTVPEHLAGVSLSGPQGTSIFARASNYGEFRSRLAVQLMALHNGTKLNAAALCKIVRM